MDSLLFLCARRVVAQHPLPTLPADLYPVLFQAAFLDGRPQVLQDLVAAWPFPVLNFQRLVGHRELLRDHDCTFCIKAVIQGVVVQLRRELEEPGRHSSLRMLDMTGLSDSVSGDTPVGLTVWFSTEAFAKACVEVSKHQQQFQRCGSGADTGMEVHIDLCAERRSCGILYNALRTGAAGPLRLKCREFEALDISPFRIVTLLESLDPSFVRRVKLCFNHFPLTGLSVILPHLSRFLQLRSLKLQCNNVEMMQEPAIEIRRVGQQLGMLPGIRELSLGSSRLSGNLRQILCDFQAPLESLELGYCSLIPADLTFLSQSFHAPALKRLDLSGQDFSRGLLEPLQLLLEKTSASLLYLDLMECNMADSHLAVLLPTLLRCSRLRFLGLHGNSLSTTAIKDLLQKTLELPALQQVVYPIPEDCYNPESSEFDCDFGEVFDVNLFEVAKEEFSHILANSGRTNLIWTYNCYGHGALDYFSL